jgi:hypothetical protein
MLRERRTWRECGSRRAATLIELLVAIGIVGLLAGLLLSGVQAARDATDHVVHASWVRQRRLDEPPPRTTMRVLFIGNSHTFVNDVPGLVTALAARIGCRITAKGVVAGGQTLEGHWDGPEARRLIESEWWDFVVLQEQSTRPVIDPDGYRRSATQFCDLARHDAVPLLYLCWAREDAPATQDALTAQAIEVTKAAKDVEICPVGEAWRKVRAEQPQIALFSDGNHASEAGSYLTACVFHAVLHRARPVGLPHEMTPAGGTRIAVDEATASVLQETAWLVAEKFRRRLKPDILKPE